MQYVAAILLAFFTWLVTFLSKVLVKRIAIYVASVAMFLSLTLAFVLSVEALLIPIKIFAPPEFFIFASFIFPDNVSVYIGVIATAHVLRWVYSYHKMLLKWKWQTPL